MKWLKWNVICNVCIDVEFVHFVYIGGDQGLLNTFWSKWSISDTCYRLPFIYNVVANLIYSYPPAIRK